MNEISPSQQLHNILKLCNCTTVNLIISENSEGKVVCVLAPNGFQPFLPMEKSKHGTETLKNTDFYHEIRKFAAPVTDTCSVEEIFDTLQKMAGGFSSHIAEKIGPLEQLMQRTVEMENDFAQRKKASEKPLTQSEKDELKALRAKVKKFESEQGQTSLFAEQS